MMDGTQGFGRLSLLRGISTEGVQRVRQRVIVLYEHKPGYCVRPPASAEVMPWDDAPEITEVDDE